MCQGRLEPVGNGSRHIEGPLCTSGNRVPGQQTCRSPSWYPKGPSTSIVCTFGAQIATK